MSGIHYVVTREKRCKSQLRSGFTLAEILIVCAILVGLMAIGFPAYQTILRSNRIAAAQALVDAVATAATQHGQSHLAISDANGVTTTHRRWDLDRDGILDGDPERDPAFDAAARSLAASARYRGFHAGTGITLPAERLDRATGRILDPWDQPLRIDFDATAYAPLGFRIRSIGPDGRPDSEDDITSSGANR